MEGKDMALLTATASTANGSFFVSSALTAYDVENLYDQVAMLGRSQHSDVRVEVELGPGAADSPEVRSFTRRMKRLQRNGVTVRWHATRGRKRGTLVPR
jgi:hypothetical protein